MIRRMAFALASMLLLAGCGSLDSEGPDEHLPPPSPALWELTSPEGNRAWLFGTLHALESGTEWRTPALDQAFGSSGALVLEVAELAEPAKLGSAFKRLAVTPGQGLVSARVRPADRARVIAVLDEAGYRDDSFGALETWAVALTLSGQLGETGLGVDRQLLDQRGSRPLYGLETVEAQYGAFDRLEEQDQAALLVAVVDEAGEPEERERRAEAWRLGRLDLLEPETRRGMLADPAVRRSLLVDRNLEWIDDIERLADTGTVPFIAVGSGHVVGSDGLPALLEARGFSLRRVQ